MRIIAVVLLLCVLSSHATNSVPAPHLTPPKPISSRLSSLAPSAEAQTSEAPSGGLISSFTQKIAKWFWPVAKDQTVAPQPLDNTASSSEARGTATTSWDGSARGRKSKCSPCNSVPWVPVARALAYPPPQSSNKSPGGYSLQVPALSLSGVPVGSQYGPPKPVYGPPPVSHPPKPEYEPPKPEYGPPKPEYGPPRPEYGPPPHPPPPPIPEPGAPQSDYGPPAKPEYGPPKPEYGPPPQPSPPPIPEPGAPQSDYGPPSKPVYDAPNPQYGSPQSEYDPLPKSVLSPPGREYGPPSTGYGSPSNSEATKPDYGLPPKPEYGPPPKSEYGSPPKPVYGPPQQEYGPPKQEYGPPKQEFGPPHQISFVQPQPDYGSPPPSGGPPSSAPLSLDYSGPSQDYSAPSQDYSAPSGDLSPPGLSSSGPGNSPPEYGPPQPNEPPKPQYGPPPQEPPPPPPPQPTNQYGPPKNMYGPPKPGYLPPSKNTYLPPPKRVPFPRQPPSLPNLPKPAFGPPRPTFGVPPGNSASSSPTSLASLAYQQYLSPPPMRAGDSYHSLNLQAIPFPELNPAPLPPIHNPTNFGAFTGVTGPNEQPKSHSNVILTINEPEGSCNKCPPSGPDLSPSRHRFTEEAKHAVANFGNLPLSDSAHESTNIDVTQVHRPNFTGSHQVEVMKSVPLTEYLSSVEYPMQIVQAPILDVPDLPKYFDLSYQSFHQHLLRNPIPSRLRNNEKVPSQNNVIQNSNPPLAVPITSPGPPVTAFSSQTTHQPRQYFDTSSATENSTYYETVPQSTAWGNTIPSTLSISPRPFVPSSTARSTKQTNHIHQIIVPYTTVQKPVQARKVPPTSPPDIEAIYVNRGVSAPDASTPSTTLDHALTASSSENVESVDRHNSLSPDTVSKLVQISQSEDSKSGLKHILATDIRALLEGEQDTVDLSRLQKNIDKWTVEGFGRRDTIPKQTSKKIPDYFFTTETPPKYDHQDTAASQHYPIYFKGNSSPSSDSGDNDELNDAAFMHEVYGWSLLDTQLKNDTHLLITTKKSATTTTVLPPTTTQKPWEELEVSISPLTKEKVYVVTPQTTKLEGEGSTGTQTSSNSSTIKYEQSSRVTRQLTAPDNSHSGPSENVQVVTPTSNRNNRVIEPDNDMIPELPATVTYIGSASSLRHSSVQFSQSSSST